MKTKICLLSLLFLTYCEGKDKAGEEHARNIMTFWMTLRTSPPYYVVEDNKDGTLETIQYKETTWLLGLVARSRTPTGYIIKKCIQGQVYRAEQNDCKGKGTAADWWGAEKFQWCQTNDRACERTYGNGVYFADSTKAVPNIICQNDAAAGKKWSFPTGVGSLYLDYLQRKDEIPVGEGEYYWTPYTSKDNDTLALSNSFTDNQFYDSKTNYHYVLCGGSPK